MELALLLKQYVMKCVADSLKAYIIYIYMYVDKAENISEIDFILLPWFETDAVSLSG